MVAIVSNSIHSKMVVTSKLYCFSSPFLLLNAWKNFRSNSKYCKIRRVQHRRTHYSDYGIFTSVLCILRTRLWVPLIVMPALPSTSQLGLKEIRACFWKYAVYNGTCRCYRWNIYWLWTRRNGRRMACEGYTGLTVIIKSYLVNYDSPFWQGQKVVTGRFYSHGTIQYPHVSFERIGGFIALPKFT